MMECLLQRAAGSPLNLLCLGAHSDDLEIGCGGSVLKLTRTNPDIHVTWVVFSATEERRREATDSADAFLERAAKKDIVVADFRDGFFPYTGGEIKDYFEALKTRTSPDLILTHYRHDLHQDHRTISELTWNTYRHHFILEYELPKYDGDLGSPNVFIELDESLARLKSDNIAKYFRTQHQRQWFSNDLFLAILRLRGMESASPTGYAEAFYARKLILGADF
jgi:LmbE family N-acetylglucosaminyl deacetylase